MVAGERATRGVCAVHAGGQPDNQQACISIAKGGNWTRMVIRVFFANLVKKPGEPGAGPAVGIKFQQTLL